MYSIAQNKTQHQDRDRSFPVCVFEENVSWNAFIRSMSWQQSTILFLSIMQNCLCWVIEGNMVFYLALFNEQTFSMSLPETAAMLLTMTMCFAVTNVLIPKWIKRAIPCAYLITIASSLLCITSFILSLSSNEVVVYWICAPIYGYVPWNLFLCNKSI